MKEGKYFATYIGRTISGFTQGQEYDIKISKDRYGYVITGTNIQSGELGYMNYASEISIKQSWVIPDENILEEGEEIW